MRGRKMSPLYWTILAIGEQAAIAAAHHRSRFRDQALRVAPLTRCLPRLRSKAGEPRIDDAGANLPIAGTTLRRIENRKEHG